MTKILVIEDDRTLRDTLAYNLRREDFIPILAQDAPTGVVAARQHHPDLVLLDLMLPGGNGFDVCRELRTFTSSPIIMLTARGEDIDRVLGLEIGADDYVTKPFGLRELMARIKANLRRVELDREPDSDTAIELGPFRVDAAGHRILVYGHPLTLQPREYDLLVHFIRNPEKVLTRPRLLASVWGHEFVGERTVDVHVRRLRAKLEAEGAEDPIRTVHGVGYIFETGRMAPAPTG